MSFNCVQNSININSSIDCVINVTYSFLTNFSISIDFGDDEAQTFEITNATNTVEISLNNKTYAEVATYIIVAKVNEFNDLNASQIITVSNPGMYIYIYIHIIYIQFLFIHY